MTTCSHVYDESHNGVQHYAYCERLASISLVGVPYCERHATYAIARVRGNYLTL